jgi:hypothetical protein
MAKRLSKLAAKFSRLQHLNGLIDDKGDEALDARRVKRGLADKWTRRRSNNVQGYFKQASAKPGACTQGVTV